VELTVNGFIRLEASRESGRNMDRLIEVFGKSCTHIGSADVNFECKKHSIPRVLADLRVHIWNKRAEEYELVSFFLLTCGRKPRDIAQASSNLFPIKEATSHELLVWVLAENERSIR